LRSEEKERIRDTSVRKGIEKSERKNKKSGIHGKSKKKNGKKRKKIKTAAEQSAGKNKDRNKSERKEKNINTAA
jgi:hypothetical protein